MKSKKGGSNMDIEKWLDGAAKWILPFFGFLFIAQQIFGLTFRLAFKFV